MIFFIQMYEYMKTSCYIHIIIAHYKFYQLQGNALIIA